MNTHPKHKKVVRNSVSRVLFTGIAVLLQVSWLVVFITQTGKYYPYISIGAQIAALFIVIAIYSQRKSSASKMLWITLTLLFPIFGLVLFTLLGQPWSSKIVRKRMESVHASKYRALQNDQINTSDIDSEIIPQVNYLKDWCGFPIYNDTEVTYHGDTKEAYRDLLAELKKAKKFIFMEYHAIEDSKSFKAIEDILAERAAAGVDVRLLYDDVGSAVFIGKDFREHMNSRGIDCRVFNPLVPFVLAFMNNRDHRKITVIDGVVGFTGGYNLADEYFNIHSAYGYWQDAGIMLKGSAVNSLTYIFMELWNSTEREPGSIDQYIVHRSLPNRNSYVLPYSDSPLDDERVAENVYMNALKHAKKRAWFTTPYLILDDEMISELTLAAKRGVDVRIITPGIPDKKIVYQLTRAYYDQLVRNNVRIFEFSPGFIHEKHLLTDDNIAIIGTSNLDYRSLYLHFENCVFLYNCDCISDIKTKLDSLFAQSREVTRKDIENRPIRTRILQNVLRLFSPLL